MTDGISASLRTVASAARAWSAGGGPARGRVLFKVADALHDGNAWPGIRNVVDAVRWYAGWADKFEAVGGTLNATPGSHRSETRPVAMGLVVVFVPRTLAPLPAFASVVIPALAAGNGVVALFEDAGTAEERAALDGVTAGALKGEVAAHFGVSSSELPQLVTAPEVDAVAVVAGSASLVEAVERASAETMVRTIVLTAGDGERGSTWPSDDSARELPVLSLCRILRFTEPRTIWRTASS